MRSSERDERCRLSLRLRRGNLHPGRVLAEGQNLPRLALSLLLSFVTLSSVLPPTVMCVSSYNDIVRMCPHGPRSHPTLPTCSSDHMRAQLALQRTYTPRSESLRVSRDRTIADIRAWLAARGEPEK